MIDRVARDASVSPIARTNKGGEGFDSEEESEFYRNQQSEEEESDQVSTEESSEDGHSTPSSNSEQKPDTDKILSNSSTDVRCRILQNEVFVLKTERGAWSQRERDLLDRLQNSREDLREQRKKLLDAQRNVQALSQEVDLINARAKIRQSTLENSYRTLCENVRLAEEASLRARIELRRLQTRNLVLEELVHSRALTYDKLDAKLREIMAAYGDETEEQATSDTGYMSIREEGEERGMDVESSERIENVHQNNGESEITMSTAREVPTGVEGMDQDSSRQEARTGSSEGSRMIMDKPNDVVNYGNSRVNERSVQFSDGMQPTPAVPELNGLAQLMETHLRQMIACSKETERQMREAVDAQIEELKEMLLQARADLSYKTEECNKLTRSLENSRNELEIAKNNLCQNLELQSQVNCKYQDKLLELESLQRELEVMESRYEEAKRELEASMLREKQNQAAFDEYVKDTDTKLFKMELLLSSSGKEAEKADTTDKVVKPEESEEIIQLKQRMQKEEEERGALLKQEYEKKLGEMKEGYEKTLNEMKVKCEQLTKEVEERATQTPPTQLFKAAAAAPATATTEGDQQTKEGQVKFTQEQMVRMAKKEALLTEKLKAEVVRAYALDKRVKQLEARLRSQCLCRKSLKHADATKRKRCWCRFKRIGELKKNIASAALKKEVSVIGSVKSGASLSKRRRVVQKKQ